MLLYRVGCTTQLPIGGWYSLFSMGKVKSGWLSKFRCIPELFRVIPEWSGYPVLFWVVPDWSGHHWMPLTGYPRLESSIDELQPESSQRPLVPVPLGSYNKSHVA